MWWGRLDGEKKKKTVLYDCNNKIVILPLWQILKDCTVIIYCSSSVLKFVCTIGKMTCNKSYENWPNVAGMGKGGGRVDKCYKLSNRRGCGGGWWTDRPPIFHFILWIGSRSNFVLFSRLIFVTGLILEVIVFLGISFVWWKKPAKLGN